MEDFEEIRNLDIHSVAEEELPSHPQFVHPPPHSRSPTPVTFIEVPPSQAPPLEPFEEVPLPPRPSGKETAPLLPLRQALQSAAMDPARMYELQDRRAAKTTTGSFTVKHEELYYNVMAVGGSGLGKTTLLRNLFQGYAGDTQLPGAGKRSYATIDEFIRDPCGHTWAPFRVIDESTCKSVQVKVVDVPGYGFEVDMPHREYVRKLMTFVLQQKAKDYATYTSKAFQTDIMGKLRSTLSVCLYFLAPHTMRPLDLVLMAALSKEVPVIPVIAQADAMSPMKRVEYAEHVMRHLSNPSHMLPHWHSQGPVEVVPVTPEDKDKLGVDADRILPPFAVMGSEDLAAVEEDTHNYCPVIHTMAGSLEVMNRHFCDTILLKRFLMGDSCYGFWNILSAATNRYLSFCERVEAMNDRRMDKKVVRLAEEISAMCQLAQHDSSSAQRSPPPHPASPEPSLQAPTSPATSSKPTAASPATHACATRSRCSCTFACSLLKGLMPILKAALLLVLIFGAFLAGTRRAVVPQRAQHDSKQVPLQLTTATMGAEVGRLPSGRQQGLQDLLPLGSGQVVEMEEEICTGSNTTKWSSPQPSSSSSSGNEPFSSDTQEEAAAVPAGPGAPKGSNVFSSLADTQLPGSELVLSWTQDALSWAQRLGQKRPRVVKRSGLLAVKAAQAAWHSVERVQREWQTRWLRFGVRAWGRERQQPQAGTDCDSALQL